MPEASTLAVFSLAALALLVVPGPAVIYIVTRSIGQGRRAGVVSVLGIHVGTVAHVTAAALGLSALLVSSALAFSIVKYAGAAYLIYLGIRRLLDRNSEDLFALPASHDLRRVFVQGIVVNVLNPKTALFFFAFLPQFVNPTRGSVGVQIMIFGLVFIGLGMLSDGTYALLAGSAGEWLRSHGWFIRASGPVTGGVYISLGVAAALSGGHRNGPKGLAP